MTNQSDLQQSIRTSTGTALTYEGDWHALFDAAGASGVTFNERLLNWINGDLGSSYTELPAAQQAFADSKGVNSWDEVTSI